jgi:hypothetical protein
MSAETQDEPEGTKPRELSDAEFMQEIGRLAKLPPALYERVRADEARRLGMRVAILDKEVAAARKAEKDDKSIELKQADQLVTMAERAYIFRTADRVAYADVFVHQHRETRPVVSKGFKAWLRREFYIETHTTPAQSALDAAIGMIEAHCLYDAAEHVVYTRTAQHEGRFYLDLCNEEWSAVEIDADGWRIVPVPPVRFRRAAGMQPLPEPIKGGAISDLREFINVAPPEHGDHDDFILIIAWLLAALRPVGPYPILGVNGEHGTAKSTACEILRMLIDPNTSPLRSPSREDRDLYITSNNSGMIAFDNVSTLPMWLSDGLCRIATGGGFGTRQLWTDSEEALFATMRPILLNGIDPMVERPDLADRTIYLVLEEIPDDKRRLKSEVLAEVSAKRPALLGALLDAVVVGIRELPKVRLEKLPRMADFAAWAVACETAFTTPGKFLAAYEYNIATATEDVVGASPVAAALCAMMRRMPDHVDAPGMSKFEGTFKELLQALNSVTQEIERPVSKGWPVTPRALSSRLRRCAPPLRKLGIRIVLKGHKRAGSEVTITCTKPAEE